MEMKLLKTDLRDWCRSYRITALVGFTVSPGQVPSVEAREHLGNINILLERLLGPQHLSAPPLSFCFFQNIQDLQN